MRAVAEDGTTFLDQFRAQVTEIGNALGYVRLVRSGGMQHCSDAIKFVPDLEDMPIFQEFLLVADSAEVGILGVNFINRLSDDSCACLRECPFHSLAWVCAQDEKALEVPAAEHKTLAVSAETVEAAK